MARTTADNIKAVVEVDPEIITVDADLDPFIATATAIVDAVCLDSDYDATTLELIERWLAGHCYRIRDSAFVAESVNALGRGGISANYLAKADLGLNQTREGQMALIVDTAGNLANLNAAASPSSSKVTRKKASGFWLGE